jgi:hypothetical protein
MATRIAAGNHWPAGPANVVRILATAFETAIAPSLAVLLLAVVIPED